MNRLILTAMILATCSKQLLCGQDPNVPENVPSQPTAVFSAMLWGKQGAQAFAYAPWDNHLDVNGTIIQVPVRSGNVSPKFAYYGKGMISFHAPRENPQLEEFSETVEINATNVTSERKTVATCNLTLASGKTMEYLLLFVQGSDGSTGTKWKIYPIPFDAQRIPPGHFFFSSQTNAPLKIKFGEAVFSLSPGKPKLQKAQTTEGSRIIRFEVSAKKTGNEFLLLSQQWPHAEKLRGLVYLSGKDSAIQATRIADFPKPIEQSIGFGVPPKIMTIENNRDFPTPGIQP